MAVSRSAPSSRWRWQRMSQEAKVVAQAKTDHSPLEEGIDAEAELLLV